MGFNLTHLEHLNRDVGWFPLTAKRPFFECLIIDVRQILWLPCTVTLQFIAIVSVPIELGTLLDRSTGSS